MAKQKSTPRPLAGEGPGESAAERAESPVDLVAVEPILHDGTRIEPGETFAAAPAVAESLLAAGAALNPAAGDGQPTAD